MRPTWTPRPPRRCFIQSKKISLLILRCHLRLEIWHCAAAAYWRLPKPLRSQPSTLILRNNLQRNLRRSLDKNLQNFHFIIYNIAEKSVAPGAADAPVVPEQVLSKEPNVKPAKIPGRVATGKKLAERNRLASEAEKNQNRPEAPAKERRSQRTQAVESQLFTSWHWRSGCLRTGCLLSAGGNYGHPPGNPCTKRRCGA